MSVGKKLGRLLCEKSYIDDAELAHGLTLQQSDNDKLGSVLVKLGYVTRRQLTETLAEQAGIPFVGLEDISIEQGIIEIVPAELVSKYNLLPLSRLNGHLNIAMTDPFQTRAVKDLRLVTGCSIRRHYCNPVEMEKAALICIYRRCLAFQTLFLLRTLPARRKRHHTDHDRGLSVVTRPKYLHPSDDRCPRAKVRRTEIDVLKRVLGPKEM